MIEAIKNKPIPYELLLEADPEKSVIETYIHQSDIFLKTTDGKVIGVIALLRHSEHNIEIKNVAVSDLFRGKGYGKELIRFAEEWCKKEGFSELFIGTGNSSVDQLALYQRLGFEIDSIKHHFFTQEYTTPIIENGIECKHMIMLKKSL